MRHKFVDLALAGLMASVAMPALAQDAGQQAEDRSDDTTPVECTDDTCTDGEGTVFRLRTRSYARPVTTGTDKSSSSEALQPDRRVTIATEQPGQATAIGKFSISLPNGGVIWATEDPTLGQPELSVSAPTMSCGRTPIF